MQNIPHNDDERDAGLTAIYRAGPPDAPPVAVDAAILAAARREVSVRPRPAGFLFHSWRGPLSIAAVIVLSVSLVTLMREEAPELTAPPRADGPSESKLKTADVAADSVERGSGREELQPKSAGPRPPQNIGLTPPQTPASSGLGIRPPEPAGQVARLKKDAYADRRELDAASPIESMKRRDLAQDAGELRDKKMVASNERQNKAAESETPRAFAQAPATASPRKEEARPGQPAAPAANTLAGAAADSKTQAGAAGILADRVEPAARLRAQASDVPARPMTEPAPAFAPSPPEAKPAPPALSNLERNTGLAPDIWLERIEELRKQGRLDEARKSLAEFKKRYPDYHLPDSLRELAKP